MKKMLCFFGLMFLLTGCPSNSGGTTSPVLTPIADVGCVVEQAITSGFGSLVVAQCAGTNALACGAAFQVALGNVNLCATPQVAQVTKEALMSKAAKPQGIVGSIVCPIALNTVMGLLTATVPAACGCTQNLSASAISGLLNAACVAAVPL